MKLNQLKYLKAIKDNNLNISAASSQLFTTQPGISKQIGLLEQELGVRIFERKGKNLSSITPIGEKIIAQVEQMLTIEQNIKTLASQHLKPDVGSFNIYTTQTIARYIISSAVSYFAKKYPNINFHLYPTLPVQSKGTISKGYSDISIIAHDIVPDSDLIIIPAYRWSLSLVVPCDHPLANIKSPNLQQLAQYPILTYAKGASGRTTQDEAFKMAQLTPTFFMTVMDADVIKHYVDLGFGIGIISSIAARNITSNNLTYINLDHLFKPSMAWLCFSKNILLQNYMCDFINEFCPHLTKTVLEKVLTLPNQEKIDEMFNDIELLVY